MVRMSKRNPYEAELDGVQREMEILRRILYDLIEEMEFQIPDFYFPRSKL